MARERSPESEIEAKSDGDRRLLLVVGVCAELVTEPKSAAQQSKLGNDIGRIMLAPSIAITTFPRCKSSFRKRKTCESQSLMEEDQVRSVCRDRVLDLAMPAPVLAMKSPR